MDSAATTISRSAAAGFGREFASAFAASFRRHRFLHGFALAALVISLAVGAYTGVAPDFGIIRDFALYLATAFWLVGVAVAILRCCWLALVVKSANPFRDFIASTTRFFVDKELIANGLNGIAAAAVFSAAFGVFKGAIAVVSPFAWDQSLAEASRFLHFGYRPYQLLWPVIRHPLDVQILNFAYNFWFVILIVTEFAAAFARRDNTLRHQFLMSFMLAWSIGGVLVAMAFSSAGPCFYARLGFGEAYQPLMAALRAIDHNHSLWALSTQDALWQGYTGVRPGSAGISAFPSMHVCMATLFALYWQRRSAAVGAALWAFAALILMGSIVLGWHYAVDGYAGAAIAVAIWKIAGRYAPRFAGDERRLAAGQR